MNWLCDVLFLSNTCIKDATKLIHKICVYLISNLLDQYDWCCSQLYGYMYLIISTEHLCLQNTSKQCWSTLYVSHNIYGTSLFTKCIQLLLEYVSLHDTSKC